MPVLDRGLEWLGSLITRRHTFFADGPGDPGLLEDALRLPFDPPREVEVRLGHPIAGRAHTRYAGSFATSAGRLLPASCRIAGVELIVPRREAGGAVLHLAATGDGGMARRRLLMAAPLLEDGVTSLLLENPYYGRRRPAEQRGAAVRTVADGAAMARGAVEEARSLLLWLAGRGYDPIAVTGVSMGGQVAAMAAASVDLDVACIPCVPSCRPGPVFCRGELSRAVGWKALEAAWGTGARTRLEEAIRRADVRRLPPPRRSDAAVIVGALEDAFVPPFHASEIHQHWPGSELRWLQTGHIGSVVRHHRAMNRAVRDALVRLQTPASAGRRASA